MPQQPGHSRFRPEDLTTRPVSSFRDLDAMTMYVDYLLMRIGAQCEEVERKLVAFEALERDQRARALREIKDNYKELLTGTGSQLKTPDFRETTCTFFFALLCAPVVRNGAGMRPWGTVFTPEAVS